MTSKLWTPLKGHVGIVVADAQGRIIEETQGDNAVMPYLLFLLWSQLTTSTSADTSTQFSDGTNIYPSQTATTSAAGSYGFAPTSHLITGNYSGSVPTGNQSFINAADITNYTHVYPNVASGTWFGGTVADFSVAGQLSITNVNVQAGSQTATTANIGLTNDTSGTQTVDFIALSPAVIYAQTSDWEYLWTVSASAPATNATFPASGNLAVTTLFQPASPVSIPVGATITIAYALSAVL